MYKEDFSDRKTKKIKVRLVEKEKKKLYISTPFIKLDSAMKLSDSVSSGGMAKMLIEDGLVSVNGEKCFSRGKKLFPGDKFEYEKLLFEVALKDEGQKNRN